MSTKSTVDDIRRRFDADVERFSNLETGQSATIDAPQALELVTEAAASSTPKARAVLDVGCGAGNYTLKLLQRLPDLDVTLLDLSRPMLDRAVERVSAATRGKVTAVQGDVREADLPTAGYDVILAAAVLHHLRTDAEWKAVFARFHRLLRPGGSVWVADLVEHENPAVQAAMWRRYGDYLVALKGEAYRDEVFAYVEREDTPRSVTFQLELLRKSGFVQVDVLHKNNCFAAFGGTRSRRKLERE
jgi:tRNA (cmo5U34)-methyltransferase